jgi:hypothetical protein
MLHDGTKAIKSKENAESGECRLCSIHRFFLLKYNTNFRNDFCAIREIFLTVK